MPLPVPGSDFIRGAPNRVMMITLAVTGKGGVGKTSIAAGLARTFARKGNRVIALDMDPSPNLWYSLGCGREGQPADIIPLISREDLITERTGAPPGASGVVFRINPKVDDLLDMIGVTCRDGVRLLVLGAIRTGGGGCFCPANTLARRLVSHLSEEADILIMDMEAGVEHLGRGTTRSAEALLIVVEPGLKTVEIALQIAKLQKTFIFPTCSRLSTKSGRTMTRIRLRPGFQKVESKPFLHCLMTMPWKLQNVVEFMAWIFPEGRGCRTTWKNWRMSSAKTLDSPRMISRGRWYGERRIKLW